MKPALHTPAATPLPAARRQKGVSLAITLVALVIMSLAGLALIRSVDTATLVAGNYAFKGASQNIADVAAEGAVTYLDSIVSATAPANANLPNACANAVGTGSLGTCRYYARAQNVDADGIPFIDWSNANIPVFSSASIPPGSSTTATIPTGYTLQFVVERLCTQDGTVSVNLQPRAKYAGPDGIANRCLSTLPDPRKVATGKAAGTGAGAIQDLVDVHYRVTVRIAGPRNTVTFAQAILQR